MKQFKTIHLFMLYTVVVSMSVFAQGTTLGTKTLGDGFNDMGNGTTGFSITDYDSGISPVIIDNSEVLRLTPNVDTLMFSRPGGWTLSGIQWQYDNSLYTPANIGYVSHVTDVDDVSSEFKTRESSVYLVTDFDQNKVFIHHKGRNNILVTQTVPTGRGAVDADLVTRNNQKIVLVTYQSSNRVIQIDFELSEVIWEYGANFGDLISPSDAEFMINTHDILIADTGNRRVIIVNDSTGTVDWEYRDPDNLAFNPVDVEEIDQSQVLITDQASHRVLIVDRATDSIIWQYGTTGLPGSDDNHLRFPADADWVPETQKILIADKGNNRILEVGRFDSTVYIWPNAVNEVDDVDAAMDTSLQVDGSFLVAQKETIDGNFFWLPTVLAFAPPADKEGPIPTDIAIIRNGGGEEIEVDFQNIRIYAENPDLTHIQYQFRSAGIDGDIDETTPWRGPTGIDSKYTFQDSVSVPLDSYHKPHSSCQFGAHLSTDSLRITPQIDSIGVEYNFYNISSSPSLFLRGDTLIGPYADAPVTVVWDTLTLFWKRVNVEKEEILLDQLRYSLFIRNAQNPSQTLLEMVDLQPKNGKQKIVLSNEMGLRGAKQILFEIELKTLNSGLTPQLDGWQFAWHEIVNGPPSIQFTDSSFVPVEFYTADTSIPTEDDSIFVNRMFLSLSNVLEPSNTVDIDVTSSTGDMETVALTYNELNLRYESGPMNILLLNAQNPDANPSDGTLELFDREELFVQFQSDQRPGEILMDSIIVVQGTIGTLSIQNSVRQDITEAQIDQTLHVRVTGELDRNLDPVAQDTIFVLLQNDMTSDRELVTMLEDSAGGVFNTGIFFSDSQTLLSSDSNSPPNDGELYTRLGDRISAQYKDNFLKEATYRFIVVPDTMIIDQALSDLAIEVAPNPYRERDGHNFRMRIKSDLADLTLEKLEIYNFAGELVLEVNGQQVTFSNSGANTVPVFQWGYVDNWWNLLNSSGDNIASGTYWLRAKARVNQETLSAKTKFVVIR